MPFLKNVLYLYKVFIFKMLLKDIDGYFLKAYFDCFGYFLISYGSLLGEESAVVEPVEASKIIGFDWFSHR